jgi:hypothetical protein
MAEDIIYRHIILHQKHLRTSKTKLQINKEMYNEALILIEGMYLMLTNKGLIQLKMTTPNCPKHDAFNQELKRETQNDSEALKETILRKVSFLNEQQKYAYDTLIKVVNDGNGGFFCLDEPVGTGKTFLISLILAMIRSQNGIALALASSSIAVTLLEGGRRAHSAFKLPLNMQIN